MQTDKTFHNNRFNIFIKTALLSFFVVTTSGYALSIVEGSLYYYYLFMPTSLMLLFILASKNHSILQMDIYHLSYIGLCLTLTLSFISNYNSQYFAYNIRFLVTISFAFFFTLIITQKDFIEYFIIVMKYVVVVSLIVFVLVNFLNISINLPIVQNINGVRYYNGIIFFVFEGYVQGRNTGCFWEPGVFATFITFAMIFEICLKEKYSKWNIVIFTIGLLSTQSTAGYFMIVFILLLVLSKKVNSIKAIIGFFVVLFGAFFLYFNTNKILYYLVMINPRVFSKLLDQTTSISHRMNSPIANLEIFRRYPIFGAGIGNSDAIIYSQIATESQTSTSTYFLAAFGIFGIMYTLLWIYGILNYKKVNILTRTTIAIMVLLIVNKEPHTFFTATYIIMFYFLQGATNNKKLERISDKELACYR